MTCLPVEPLLQMIFIFSESPTKLCLAKVVIEGEMDYKSTQGNICQIFFPLSGPFPIRQMHKGDKPSGPTPTEAGSGFMSES